MLRGYWLFPCKYFQTAFSKPYYSVYSLQYNQPTLTQKKIKVEYIANKGNAFKQTKLKCRKKDRF